MVLDGGVARIGFRVVGRRFGFRNDLISFAWTPRRTYFLGVDASGAFVLYTNQR